MVFFNPAYSGPNYTRRLPFSTSMLFPNIIKGGLLKHNFLYLFKFTVVYFAQKRNVICSATTTTLFHLKNHCKDHSCSINPQFKANFSGMCPLHSQNNDIIFEKYKSYYNSGTKKYYRDALFVLGPMGSGKTTIINEKIQTHKIYGNYAYVDTDEIMEKLPGFNKQHVNAFYPSARQIAIRLTDWLLENQFSFVAEGTCVMYQELLDYMIRLKRKGYSIKVCRLPKVKLEIVLSRAANRERRKIDRDTVKDIYLQSDYGLQELFKVNKENTIFETIEIEKL